MIKADCTVAKDGKIVMTTERMEKYVDPHNSGSMLVLDTLKSMILLGQLKVEELPSVVVQLTFQEVK